MEIGLQRRGRGVCSDQVFSIDVEGNKQVESRADGSRDREAGNEAWEGDEQRQGVSCNLLRGYGRSTKYSIKPVLYS